MQNRASIPGTALRTNYDSAHFGTVGAVKLKPKPGFLHSSHVWEHLAIREDPKISQRLSQGLALLKPSKASSALALVLFADRKTKLLLSASFIRVARLVGSLTPALIVSTSHVWYNAMRRVLDIVSYVTNILCLSFDSDVLHF